jgi:hypothetical protein
MLNIDGVDRCIMKSCKGCYFEYNIERFGHCEGLSRDWMKGHPEIQLVDFSDRDTDSDEQGRSDVDLICSEKGAFFSIVALVVVAVVALVYAIVSKI